MRTADDLLAEISDELSRKVSSAVGALISASPELKVLPGFPFTLMRTDTPVVAGEAIETTRPAPPIYRINPDSRTIDFYLGCAKTTNGDYPVRMSLTNSRQFFFLKIVADVTSVCKTSPGSGPPLNTPGTRLCITEDVTTVSVTVVSRTSIPEQENPTSTNPAGEEEEGVGWGGFYGSPSGRYTVYLPLVCLNFNDSIPVSWVGDSASRSEYIDKNPMWSYIIDATELGGISGLLWWSGGRPQGAVEVRRGGDPGALWDTGIFADYLDPEDSQYVLSSL